MTLRKTTALQLARSSAKTVSEKLRRSCFRVVVLPDLDGYTKGKDQKRGLWGIKRGEGKMLGDVRDHNREGRGRTLLDLGDRS